MAIPNGNGKGIKWDGTISAGTILAMVGIAAPMVFGGVTAINQIRDIQRTMDKQGTEFSNRLDKVEGAISDFRTEFAKRDGLGLQVADHEQRLRRLEQRG